MVLYMLFRSVIWSHTLVHYSNIRDGHVVIASFRLDILACHLSNLKAWRVLYPRRPFWRYYWNRDAGAMVKVGGRKWPLAPDRVVLIPPNTHYGVVLSRPVEHFYIHFNAGLPFDHIKPGVLSVSVPREERQALDAFASRARREAGLTSEDVLRLSSLVTGTLSAIPRELWPRRVGDERIEAVVQEIETDPTRQWRNPDLARIAHMATNAFIRRFGQVMRISPLRYVASRRLDQARILLEHSNQSIEAIADACGFCSRSHLSTAFQSAYEVGPAKYRRMTREV